jgi:sec-independent protein translocase protein TatA
MSFLQNIGTTEIIIVAIVIVLLFGGKKIPEFIKGMAEAVREFKKGNSKDK